MGEEAPGADPCHEVGSLGFAGGIGLFVDAKEERAAAFYRKFGFEPAPTSPLTL